MELSIRGKKSSLVSNSLFYLVPLLDELISASFSLGIPLLYKSLHLTILEVGLLFGIGGTISLIVDPIVNIISERSSPRWWLLGSFGLLGCCLLLISWGSGFWLLLLLYSCWHCLAGIQAGQAQRLLVERDVQKSVQTMTRWTLLASIGDLLGPLIIPLAVITLFGWQILFWSLGGIILVITLFLFFLPSSIWSLPRTISDEEETGESFKTILKHVGKAVRNPNLLRWVVVMLIADLMDEMFISFVTLYLVEEVGINGAQISIILTAGMLAALCSLFLMDRLRFWQRYPSITILRALSIITVIGVCLLLINHNLWLIMAGNILISFSAAWWYPLAKGEAYRIMPEHTGIVRAVANMTDPVLAIIGSGVGIIAGSVSVLAGVGVLCSAPLWVLLLCWKQTRK